MNYYYRFSEYLKKTYGERVQKITVDAGFSCPNRDGTLGKGGCIYCDVEGFSINTSKVSRLSIKEQIAKGQEYARKRHNVRKFMVYFQAFSNTYGDVAELKGKYDEVLGFDGIEALAIGTRPDCIDREKLELIDSYSDKMGVWVEYGLQSMHDRSLRLIKRGHDFAAFDDAMKLTKDFSRIKKCVHVILGLPGESLDDMLATADYLAKIGVDAVKLHPLHVMKGTDLEEMYLDGKCSLMSYDEYLEAVVHFIAHLPENIVIQRLTAECAPELLVAPDWLNQKSKTLMDIEKRFCDLGLKQGSACEY